MRSRETAADFLRRARKQLVDGRGNLACSALRETDPDLRLALALARDQVGRVLAMLDQSQRKAAKS